ncbi:hypothetical protein [Flavobacterium sp.]|uniref:hypothetical protein n=1 Tax=Flavobacterium sp. TaxID=239 RepID=UPI00404782C0
MIETDVFLSGVKAFNFLTDDFSYENYFDKNYKHYQIEKIKSNPELFNILEQFKNKNIRDFYNKSYLEKEGNDNKYLDEFGIIEDSQYYKVQYEIPKILILYLMNYYKDDLNKFLEFIKVDNLDYAGSEFYYKKDEYLYIRTENIVEEYTKFRKNNLNFDLFRRILESSLNLIKFQQDHFLIRIHDINHCLKVIDTKFNFNGFELH